MADVPLVVLNNVDKRYGRGAIGAADVSLKVDRGEMVALFGPSGSGRHRSFTSSACSNRPTRARFGSTVSEWTGSPNRLPPASDARASALCFSPLACSRCSRPRRT